jgi:alpha-galactosidase
MTRSNPKRIVIVGGGSTSWTVGIVRDMMLTPALSGSTFVLYDLDLRAAQLVAGILRGLEKLLRTACRIIASSDRDRAFEGAAYFIITISTGGLAAK